MNDSRKDLLIARYTVCFKAADILCERLPAINAERLRKEVIYQLIEEVIKEVQDERNDE